MFLAILFASGILSAQENTALKFKVPEELPAEFYPDFEGEFEDSLQLSKKLAAYRFTLIEAGYLAASLDSIIYETDTVTAVLHVGERYDWARLKPGNVPEEVLSRTGFREEVYRNAPVSPSKLSKLLSSIMDIMHNTGYPFAKLRLTNISFSEDGLRAELDLDKKMFTIIDSVIVKGNIKTGREYLENYLGISEGMPYNGKLIDKIPDRLRELVFVKIIKPFEIGMREGKADIYLYLDNKKASHFDGILGILPDEEGKILLTGDVNLSLMNALHQGESIRLQWQRLENATQELDLGFVYPFLFGTPIGTDLKFNLYRRDTLFSNVTFTAGLDYYFPGNDRLKVYIEKASTNVLTTAPTPTDDYIDSDIFMVGLGGDISELDYKFNPRRGFYVRASLATGKKTIVKNPNLDESVYEDITLESDIYNLDFDGGQYLPFAKRLTLLIRLQGGHYINENMYRNEMYRIGGLKTLRGFNEQAIFATSYGIATAEIRFITEENSNIFVFFDQGYYEDRLREDPIIDDPFGFGGGVNFETGAGLFSLTYALGKQFDNRILLRPGKIHFGFTGFF